MVGIRKSLIVAAAALLGASADPAGATISGGQVDTFESGTTQSWTNGGLSNPNPATNIATGGPAGVDDNFLRITSTGTGTAGAKLVVFNGDQWAGNYLDADVDFITMSVNNLGATALSLRLILVGGGGSLTTLADVNVPSGSGWMPVSFALSDANLSGTGVDALNSVTELNLVHGPSDMVVRSQSPNIAAVLGVDNITAVVVPEPGMIGVLSTGMLLAMRRRVARSPANRGPTA